MEDQQLNIIMDEELVVECLVIKQGLIKDLSWSDPNYVNKLMEYNLFDSLKIKKKTFGKAIGDALEINKYNIANLNVKNEVIADEPYYLYEMFYVDVDIASDTPQSKLTEENELATLLNMNGDKIYSNVIIFKNYLPAHTNNMVLCDMKKEDLQRILYDRGYNKIVMCDDDNNWYEDRVAGDLTDYAKKYFDDFYYKLEIGFLMYNINIWYTVSEFGTKGICGSLIDKPIEKALWFTMKTNDYRGNITLDEVKKIIKLSTVLTDYKTPIEFLNEKYDETYGKKIINTKYKVLDYMYDNHYNK
jgi:hypothetical protein